MLNGAAVNVAALTAQTAGQGAQDAVINGPTVVAVLVAVAAGRCLLLPVLSATGTQLPFLRRGLVRRRAGHSPTVAALTSS